MKIDINNGIICISKDTTISSGVTVKRNVMLTIKKGATLTVNGGIDAGTKTVSVMGEEHWSSMGITPLQEASLSMVPLPRDRRKRWRWLVGP